MRESFVGRRCCSGFRASGRPPVVGVVVIRRTRRRSRRRIRHHRHHRRRRRDELSLARASRMPSGPIAASRPSKPGCASTAAGPSRASVIGSRRGAMTGSNPPRFARAASRTPASRRDSASDRSAPWPRQVGRMARSVRNTKLAAVARVRNTR